MPTDEIMHDLLIVGDGPSGCAAAIAAARAGRSAGLLRRVVRPPDLFGWVGPAGVELLRSMEISVKGCGAAEFSGFRLHSWDLKKSADAKSPDLCGWLIDPGALEAALLDLARRRGVTIHEPAAVRQLHLRDQHVELHTADGGQRRGRVLLIADGVASPTAEMARVMAVGHGGPPALTAEFETARPDTALHVAIGGGRVTQLAVIAQRQRRVRVTLVSGLPDALARPTETLAQFCRCAAEAGLLPTGPIEPRSASVPAGAALDMETHVGKRCLLIGQAGGFTASFSHEGIFPSLRSGQIAAEVACRSMDARQPQDELAGFDPAWRSELADYLRMPNTDLSLLMPLVFGNAQMSQRVARAFLLGQQF